MTLISYVGDELDGKPHGKGKAMARRTMVTGTTACNRDMVLTHTVMEVSTMVSGAIANGMGAAGAQTRLAMCSTAIGSMINHVDAAVPLTTVPRYTVRLKESL